MTREALCSEELGVDDATLVDTFFAPQELSESAVRCKGSPYFHLAEYLRLVLCCATHEEVVRHVRALKAAQRREAEEERLRKALAVERFLSRQETEVPYAAVVDWYVRVRPPDWALHLCGCDVADELFSTRVNTVWLDAAGGAHVVDWEFDLNLNARSETRGVGTFAGVRDVPLARAALRAALGARMLAAERGLQIASLRLLVVTAGYDAATEVKCTETLALIDRFMNTQHG